MGDREDLARLLFDAEKRYVGPQRAAIAYAETVEQDELRRLYLADADAILDAGWVPQSRLALVRDSVRDVSQAREAALKRVRALLDQWRQDRLEYPLNDPRAPAAFIAVRECERELRAALAGHTDGADRGGDDRG